MRKIIFLISLLVLVGACTAEDKIVKSVDQEFYENMPVINGYYNNQEIWFIHPDVSSAETAEKLTRMINYKTLYVPKHNDLDKNKLSKLYVFTNGVDHKGVKPYGGGPLGYQIDIFDSIPEQKGYTALRNVYLVTWNEDSKPRILKTEKDLLEAERNKELKIEQSKVIVNVPILRWPGGSARLK